MQEIAILLSSLAGIATAAAVRRVPRGKQKLQSLGASSHIRSQISSLKIEREILTKTVSRLYQSDVGYPELQKDKLLAGYQHQLGVVLAKLEKLEQASRHPDLGPVGDGLITLMDQKLSTLDDRLDEISSKMTHPEPVAPEPIQKPKAAATKASDTVERAAAPKPSRTAGQTASPSGQTITPDIPRQGRPFELTTLTSLSQKEPEFPHLQPDPATTKEKPVASKPNARPTQEVAKAAQSEAPSIKPKIAKLRLTREAGKVNRHKALPEPEPTRTIPEDDFDDDDAADLAQIKRDIRQVLSKIDQAEVE